MVLQRIAVIGCGLLGGSFALGLKKNGFAGEVIGCDREEVLRAARERGAIDRGLTDTGEAVAGADLVVLSTPVGTILDLLPQVAKRARPGTLVTDTGSTKVRICRRAREVLPESVSFLGGHPLAGKETSGIENAEADLFAGAKYVVIKEENQAGRRDSSTSGLGMTNAGEEFLSWVRRLGAEPVEMEAETHDWAVAWISHAPQLVATALASAVWDETDEDGLPLALAASGFREMTRLAASPYDLWRDICRTNSENLARALERLEQRLARMRGQLRSGELAAEFEKARQACAALRKEGKR